MGLCCLLLISLPQETDSEPIKEISSHDFKNDTLEADIFYKYMKKDANIELKDDYDISMNRNKDNNSNKGNNSQGRTDMTNNKENLNIINMNQNNDKENK